jgi:hypothetical protein
MEFVAKLRYHSLLALLRLHQLEKICRIRELQGSDLAPDQKQESMRRYVDLVALIRELNRELAGAQPSL